MLWLDGYNSNMGPGRRAEDDNTFHEYLMVDVEIPGCEISTALCSEHPRLGKRDRAHTQGK